MFLDKCHRLPHLPTWIFNAALPWFAAEAGCRGYRAEILWWRCWVVSSRPLLASQYHWCCWIHQWAASPWSRPRVPPPASISSPPWSIHPLTSSRTFYCSGAYPVCLLCSVVAKCVRNNSSIFGFPVVVAQRVYTEAIVYIWLSMCQPASLLNPECWSHNSTIRHHITMITGHATRHSKQPDCCIEFTRTTASQDQCY